MGEKEARAMSPADAILYRRAAARINYVALDRTDLSFASRVASSHMSNPIEGDEQVIKRMIWYLIGKPRVAIRYGFQDESEHYGLHRFRLGWRREDTEEHQRRCGVPREPHHKLVVQTPVQHCFVVVRIET